MKFDVFFRTIFSILGAFAVVAVLVSIVGESPLVVFTSLFQSSFGSEYGLGYSLFYTTPLIFTGLSVALAYRSGLLNIGAEGQLYMGALALITVLLGLKDFSPLIAWTVGILAMLATGGIWAAIPGFLKAFRGSHEVIITIMMNFIAMGICNYCVLYPLKNPNSQVPETSSIATNFIWPTLEQAFGVFGKTPVNITLIVAVILAIIMHFFLKHSRLGFEFRSIGLSSQASTYAGINVKTKTILVMAISGMLASFVALNEILGSSHRFKEGFSPSYGFTGIAVALLARANPLGIILTAFLFGALHAGSLNLELDSRYISRDLSNVISAIIIVFVSIEHLFQFKPRSLWKKS